MQSHLIEGSYWERIYHPGGRMEEVFRMAGAAHLIPAARVHLLMSLPEGECWTLVLAGPVEQQWRHFTTEELAALPG